MVAENDIPLVGVHLETGEEVSFKSGADAARKLKMKSPDMPMAVVRKERTSVAGWWFRAADDLNGIPPKNWGETYRISQVQALQGKALVAINYKTREEKRFNTAPEAAEFLNVTQSLISTVARGKALSVLAPMLQNRRDYFASAAPSTSLQPGQQRHSAVARAFKSTMYW